MSDTQASIQWKGTDACIDLWCECGTDSHYDPEMPFAGTLRCPGCQRIWMMEHRLNVTTTTDQWRLDAAVDPVPEWE